jgi:hypothetical protein
MSVAATAAIAPAAPPVWPTSALRLYSGTSAARAPKVAFTASLSVRSFTSVPVPWGTRQPSWSTVAPASASAASIARTICLPPGSGAVEWYASQLQPAPATRAYRVVPGRAATCAADSRTSAAAPSPNTVPRRSRANGRQHRGSRAPSRLKQASATREYASAPTTTATAASPVRMRSAAIDTAQPPAAHALLTLMLGPVAPSRPPTVDPTAKPGNHLSSSGGKPSSRQVSCRSASPIPVPTTTAIPSGVVGPSPASAAACSAAATANRVVVPSCGSARGRASGGTA